MFVLLVELEADLGRSEELETLLSSLAAMAEHEPGTIFYSVQRPEGESGKFILCEYYTDKAAWQTHLQYAPVQEKLKRLETLLRGAPKLTLCDAVSMSAFG